MGMEFVGINQSVMMLGGVLGGIAAGALSSKLKISNAYVPIMLSGLTMIPVGLAFLLNLPYFVIYIILTAACALTLACVTMANIQVISLIQKETPTELTGKIMSLVVMLPFSAQAAGQFVYGFIFEQMAAWPHVIILATTGIVVLIAIYVYDGFKDKQKLVAPRISVSHTA